MDINLIAKILFASKLCIYQEVEVDMGMELMVADILMVKICMSIITTKPTHISQHKLPKL